MDEYILRIHNGELNLSNKDDSANTLVETYLELTKTSDINYAEKWMTFAMHYLTRYRDDSIIFQRFCFILKLFPSVLCVCNCFNTMVSTIIYGGYNLYYDYIKEQVEDIFLDVYPYCNQSVLDILKDAKRDIPLQKKFVSVIMRSESLKHYKAELKLYLDPWVFARIF
jgi:hypothetical protein